VNYHSSKFSVSVILHFTDSYSEDLSAFARILDSVLNQSLPVHEIILLNQGEELLLTKEIQSVPVKILKGEYRNLAEWLNAGWQASEGDYLLYLSNISSEIQLKQAYLEVAYLSVIKHPRLGMLYADYELLEGNGIKESHLLKHHAGRLRDNQDYGLVFLFSNAALMEVNGFDSSIHYSNNVLYDIRLKLSEKYEIIHIANKTGGALYRVIAEDQRADVFDYLIAKKELQLEAERVLSNHLKRIGAYLRPGYGYRARPKSNRQYDYLASIVIPVNNRPEFIKIALGSIFAQTIKNIEAIVVVNGGRSDPTVTEVTKYLPGGLLYTEKNPPVRLIITDINNIGLSLNLGIEQARGRYYIQLDSDDRLKPDAIAKVIELFDSDERIGIVIGSYEVWEQKGSGELVRMTKIPVVKHDEWTDENGRNNLLRINGAGAPRCIPIEVIQEMDYFGINDEPYACNYGEDYDMVLKISEKYKVGRIYEPIYEVIRHAGGTDHQIDQSTIDRNDEAKDYIRLLTLQGRIFLNRSRTK